MRSSEEQVAAARLDYNRFPFIVGVLRQQMFLHVFSFCLVLKKDKMYCKPEYYHKSELIGSTIRKQIIIHLSRKPLFWQYKAYAFIRNKYLIESRHSSLFNSLYTFLYRWGEFDNLSGDSFLSWWSVHVFLWRCISCHCSAWQRLSDLMNKLSSRDFHVNKFEF